MTLPITAKQEVVSTSNFLKQHNQASADYVPVRNDVSKKQILYVDSVRDMIDKKRV